MIPYLVKPRDRIFVKGYGFLSFAKNMDRNIGKNMSKTLGGKYTQKLLYHTKQSVTDAFKTAAEETVEATGDLIDNKSADRITKV